MVGISSGGLYRLVEEKTWVAGSPLSFDMPTGEDLDTILIEVSGTITVTTAPTSYHSDGMSRIVDRLELFSDGAFKLTEISGIMASLGNFEGGCFVDNTEPGAAATGAVTVKSTYVLDRINRDGIRPKDSSLHTNKAFMSKLTLQVKCGQITDIVNSAGSFASSANALTVKVYVAQTREFAGDGLLEQRLIKQESLIIETIDATTTNHRVKLAVGDDLLYRGAKIYALNDSGVLDSTIINNIQIKSGADVPFNLTGAITRTMNKASYRLADSQLRDGFYFADLVPHGNLKKLYQLAGKSELDLILDVTKPSGGDGSIVIVPQHFVMLPSKAA